MKLNKKGFTLVELLAVIAILAILIMLVTPNVLNMLTEGKKSAFVTQAQSIYKAAETQYVKDSINGNGSSLYSNNATSTLDISASSSLNYCVKMESGKITKIEVADGTYKISVTGSPVKIDDLKSNNLTETTTSTVTCN